MISQTDLKSILHYDSITGIFTYLKRRNSKCEVGTIAGTLDKDGYICIKILGKLYKAHRLAWFYVYGEWPKQQIDHINCIKIDNRIENLRDCSHSENLLNRHIAMKTNKTTGLLGASLHKSSGKYLSQIKYQGKVMHIGRYDTPMQAHEAYLNKKLELMEGKS